MEFLGRKAEMGMGTLIIFIAMILVAAVAASVLISTTGTLQNKALTTGKATTYQVGTSLEALELYGEDASSNNDLEEFFQTIRLASGSESLRFEDVLLTLSLSDQAVDIEYNASATCDPSAATFPESGKGYGVSYQISATNGHQVGYLVSGDVAKICFTVPRSVNESETIKTMIVPRVGSPLTISADLPDLMVDKRISIYP